MRVTVSFLGAHPAAKIAGGASVALEVPGATIADLVRELADRYGEPMRRYLLDETGELDRAFKVVVNEKEWLTREELGRPLGEGDRIAIAILVSGG